MNDLFENLSPLPIPKVVLEASEHVKKAVRTPWTGKPLVYHGTGGPVMRLPHYELLLDHRQAIPVEVLTGVHRYNYWLEIRQVHPSYVELYVEDGQHYAKATEAGYRAARAWFKLKPYKIHPKGTDLGNLRRNFNKFVEAETDWEPIKTNQLFREALLRNADMRARWAPQKDFNSYQ